jgi:hypothetical protein
MDRDMPHSCSALEMAGGPIGPIEPVVSLAKRSGPQCSQTLSRYLPASCFTKPAQLPSI